LPRPDKIHIMLIVTPGIAAMYAKYAYLNSPSTLENSG
jgi:hypothetical protein